MSLADHRQQWEVEMDDQSPSKVPGVLVLAGAAAVVASTFLPWREATPPLIISWPGQGWFLAGLAVGWGGVVGLVMLVRGSAVRLAALGVLVVLVMGFSSFPRSTALSRTSIRRPS